MFLQKKMTYVIVVFCAFLLLLLTSCNKNDIKKENYNSSSSGIESNMSCGKISNSPFGDNSKHNSLNKTSNESSKSIKSNNTSSNQNSNKSSENNYSSSENKITNFINEYNELISYDKSNFYDGVKVGRLLTMLSRLSDTEKNQISNLDKIKSDINNYCLELENKFICYKHYLNFTKQGQLINGKWNLKNGGSPKIDNFFILKCSTIEKLVKNELNEDEFERVVKTNGNTETLIIAPIAKGELTIKHSGEVFVLNEYNEKLIKINSYYINNRLVETTFYIKNSQNYQIICSESEFSYIYEISYIYV